VQQLTWTGGAEDGPERPAQVPKQQGQDAVAEVAARGHRRQEAPAARPEEAQDPARLKARCASACGPRIVTVSICPQHHHHHPMVCKSCCVCLGGMPLLACARCFTTTAPNLCPAHAHHSLESAHMCLTTAHTSTSAQGHGKAPSALSQRPDPSRTVCSKSGLRGIHGTLLCRKSSAVGQHAPASR